MILDPFAFLAFLTDLATWFSDEPAWVQGAILFISLAVNIVAATSAIRGRATAYRALT